MCTCMCVQMCVCVCRCVCEVGGTVFLQSREYGRPSLTGERDSGGVEDGGIERLDQVNQV